MLLNLRNILFLILGTLQAHGAVDFASKYSSEYMGVDGTDHSIDFPRHIHTLQGLLAGYFKIFNIPLEYDWVEYIANKVFVNYSQEKISFDFHGLFHFLREELDTTQHPNLNMVRKVWYEFIGRQHLGPVDFSEKISKKDIQKIAYHELGHALLFWLLSPQHASFPSIEIGTRVQSKGVTYYEAIYNITNFYEQKPALWEVAQLLICAGGYCGEKWECKINKEPFDNERVRINIYYDLQRISQILKNLNYSYILKRREKTTNLKMIL